MFGGVDTNSKSVQSRAEREPGEPVSSLLSSSRQIKRRGVNLHFNKISDWADNIALFKGKCVGWGAVTRARRILRDAVKLLTWPEPHRALGLTSAASASAPQRGEFSAPLWQKWIPAKPEPRRSWAEHHAGLSAADGAFVTALSWKQRCQGSISSRAARTDQRKSDHVICSSTPLHGSQPALIITAKFNLPAITVLA